MNEGNEAGEGVKFVCGVGEVGQGGGCVTDERGMRAVTSIKRSSIFESAPTADGAVVVPPLPLSVAAADDDDCADGFLRLLP